jgi:hypothetical protein
VEIEHSRLDKPFGEVVRVNPRPGSVEVAPDNLLAGAHWTKAARVNGERLGHYWITRRWALAFGFGSGDDAANS